MRVLKVRGKGEVSSSPDWVILKFDVESESMSYEMCLQMLEKRTEDLRAGIDAAGLRRAQLKTKDFRVDTKTRYVDGEHIFAGYRALHRMLIEFPMDNMLLNKVLGLVSEGFSGAEIGIDFTVKDKEAVRKKALANAVKTARKNAEILAEAAGAKLGSLLQIDYGVVEINVTRGDYNVLMEESVSFSPDFQPRDVRTEDTVNLVYEIK